MGVSRYDLPEDIARGGTQAVDPHGGNYSHV
jgi:hypothetical protein